MLEAYAIEVTQHQNSAILLQTQYFDSMVVSEQGSLNRICSLAWTKRCHIDLSFRRGLCSETSEFVSWSKSDIELPGACGILRFICSGCQRSSVESLFCWPLLALAAAHWAPFDIVPSIIEEWKGQQFIVRFWRGPQHKNIVFTSSPESLFTLFLEMVSCPMSNSSSWPNKHRMRKKIAESEVTLWLEVTPPIQNVTILVTRYSSSLR
jgi:hypothetical protein